MSKRTFERAVLDWLEDGSDRTPPPAIDAVLLAVKTTPQERDLRIPWRFPSMVNTLRVAAAAAIAIVAIGAVAYIASRPDTGNQPPAATMSARPTSGTGVGVDAPGTIFFGALDAGGERTTLWAMTPDATRERTLSTDGECCLVLANGGAWFMDSVTADGRLAPRIRTVDGAVEEIWTWSVDTIDTSRLNLRPRASSSVEPTFPDFAFEGWDDSDVDRTGIYLDRSNGGAQLQGAISRVTSNPGTLHDVPVSFSPDGSKLLFIRDGDAGEGIAGDLYVVNVDGTGLLRLNPEATRITISDAFGAGASWSPDGTEVAFAGFDETRSNGTSRVYVVSAAGGEARPIGEAGIYITSARWSPDGAWIAFDQAVPLGPHHLFRIRSDGTGLVDTTPTDDNGVCCGQWSPDGRWLVVQGGATDDATDLYIVSAEGLPTARLTSRPGGYRMWLSWVPYRLGQ